MKLSIVATLYYSANTLEELCHRLMKVARDQVGDSYEIILVNDGSPDSSLETAIAIASDHPKIVVLDLSRNFGHHKAMMTGLSYAVGEKVFLLDSDLEEEQEWLSAFHSFQIETACDVVFGVQSKRKGGLFERWTGDWFYGVFHWLTGISLPKNAVTARLMTRDYVKALIRHDEREIFIAGLWLITGFDQRPYQVVKHSTSPTTYTLRQKIKLLVNSVTAFSNAPLVAIFNVGLLISVVAASYAVYLIVNWQFFSKPLSGWTSVMASIWLLGGLIISFIGVIGIYLSKIYSETKHRPYTIVKRIYPPRPHG